MDWLLIGGCMIAAWATLSVLGGERQRLVNELIARSPAPPTDAKSAVPSSPPKKH